ncbi:Guanine nucleotide-binding-like protein 1 [Rhizophlyctis rosea]|uniref:Guanine nucleotide-binding protein-like 1 n=1 Tax=Rhizophlyctis rosea TaxID=64517 RepID=A0AAD5SL07_9FUNG|nr:Guanine nucleotide-binding-like protein 1 [Rhizophlyctis rosea]
MSTHRKKPFSAKQKKAQILEKRAKKKPDSWDWSKDEEGEVVSGEVVSEPGGGQTQGDSSENREHRSEDISTEFRKKKGPRARSGARGGPEEEAESKRLESVFAKLSPAMIEARKRDSTKPLARLAQEALEVGFDDVYSDVKSIDMPKRPPWTAGESKDALEQREEQGFAAWKDDVYSKHPADELSYFEHNLEVWRQLWRVAELSDIALFVIDSRHPVLHFPPSLFQYIVHDLGKKLVLVFNKIDLIEPATLEAWRIYFVHRFPGLLTAAFSCYPKEGFLTSGSAKEALKSRHRRRYKRYLRAVGISDVLKACRDVHLVKSGVTVDWESLITKTEKELQERHDAELAKQRAKDKDDEFLGRSRRRQRMPAAEDSGIEDSDDESTDEDVEGKVSPTTALREHEVNKDMITIGLVGHPNVGKSSLINSIVGRKVVSTSRSPGHTKHFQTIHLTPEVRLCDCPGLVFPAVMPKPVQILSGMYRIAQVQEPYTAVKYLAERVPIEDILGLKHPDVDNENDVPPWSAWNICEAYALQRGFLTGRAARPDVYRAANAILQLVNDGRIILSFKPPMYFSTQKGPKHDH